MHNICTDSDGWVYVADRENHRVQVFDGNGKYETQWSNLHRPCGLYMDYSRHPVCYIGELGPTQPVNRNAPNLGPRVSIVDHQGKLLSRFGDLHAGTAPTAFLGPHGLAVDRRGDPLRRRGVVDAVAAILSRQAAPGLHPLVAEIRADPLGAAIGTVMSRLEEALERLERAVTRLEAASAVEAASTEPSAALRLAESEAENQRLREAAGEIAARVDNALGRVERVLEGGG